MLVYFETDTRKIYGINTSLTVHEAKQYISDNCILINQDSIPNKSDNQEYYLTEDNQIGMRDLKQNIKELTQLDRIEEMISKSVEELRQEARDAYTLELIEGGVIA